VNKTAILTTIPSDAHSWNLVYMQMFLEERGCRVINLGTCAPFQQVIDACAKENPDLVVVSTTNGHGYMEGAELARLLDRLETRSRMKLVVGGKLGVDQAQDPEYAEILSNAGFDAVFYGATALGDFVSLMEKEFPEQMLESAARR
jgi:methylaspartate mutase sigma subunit